MIYQIAPNIAPPKFKGQPKLTPTAPNGYLLPNPLVGLGFPWEACPQSPALSSDGVQRVVRPVYEAWVSLLLAEGGYKIWATKYAVWNNIPTRISLEDKRVFRHPDEAYTGHPCSSTTRVILGSLLETRVSL